jgi:hypothetical protein
MGGDEAASVLSLSLEWNVSPYSSGVAGYIRLQARIETPLTSLKHHSGASLTIQVLAMGINEVYINFKLIDFVSHDRSDRILFGKSPL